MSVCMRMLCRPFKNSAWGYAYSALSCRALTAILVPDIGFLSILKPGTTFGQVKVKSKPTKLTFGGNAQNPRRENIVSVSMDRKTILLYNLDEPENALELAFQSRYGTIVNFHWFRDGFIMVAFSLGFVVVISTRAFHLRSRISSLLCFAFLVCLPCAE